MKANFAFSWRSIESISFCDLELGILDNLFVNNMIVYHSFVLCSLAKSLFPDEFCFLLVVVVAAPTPSPTPVQGGVGVG